jgi:quercetin dioxygenase-like cupin family protein
MSEIQRRNFLKGTAAFAAGVTAALTATGRGQAGDPSFTNNVPDPLFTGKELPTFKFALEKSKGRVEGKSWANADEWQYVLEGTMSMTMFGSHGRFRTETLQQGDVGYIPQGYGHSIENVGAARCRVLIGFNSGVYEDIDLTEWMAGNPPDVLATNFGKPASLFQKFPRRDVFISDRNGKT